MTIDEYTRKKLERHILRKGDIVLGRRGELGRAALITDKESGWLCGTGSMIIRIDDQKLSPAFIAEYIRLPLVKGYLEVESVGSTMNNLNSSILAHLPVPVPPLEEQHSIVSRCRQRLDEVKQLVNKIVSVTEQLQEYRTSLISAAVTGKIDVRNHAQEVA